MQGKRQQKQKRNYPLRKKDRLLVILVVNLLRVEFPGIAIAGPTIDTSGNKTPVLDGKGDGADPGGPFKRRLFRP